MSLVIYLRRLVPVIGMLCIVGVLVVATPTDSPAGSVGTQTSALFTGSVGSTDPITLYQHDEAGNILLILTCSNATLRFTLAPGGLTPDGDMRLGEATTSVWEGCYSSAGVDVSVTHQGSWPIAAETGLVGAQGGVLITSVKTQVDEPRGLCSFAVTGSARAQLSLNAKKITPQDEGTSLVISNVVGCAGMVLDGDTVTAEGSFTLP